MEEPIKNNVPEAAAEKRLRQLEDKAGVSKDAIDAFVNLCNPFPDTPVVRRGWPDAKSSPSVVVVDTFETSITQPAGLVAGETWDTHINVLPVAFESLLGNSFTLNQNGTLTGAGALSTQKGSLNIVSAKTGALPSWVNCAPVYSYGDQAQGSAFRVVAQGLEIINTTAELYRGGMAYAYRFSSPRTPANYSPSPAVVSLLNTQMVGMPPFKPSGIVNYGNTYEGMAKDGVYVINCPDEFENEPQNHISGMNWFVDKPGAVGASTVRQYQGGGTLMPWCHAGAFLTGLAQGSSLVVRLRTYMEVFPQPEDGNNLIRLTNPTVPRDPVIEQLITEVLRSMPAGCAYTDNPLGEWFNRLMTSIETFAPLVGSAIGSIFPPASLIGSGLSVVAKGAKQLNKSKITTNLEAQRKQSKQKRNDALTRLVEKDLIKASRGKNLNTGTTPY